MCPPVLILTDSYGSQVMGHRFDGSEPSGVTHRPFVEIHNGKSAAIQCLSPSQVRQIDKIVSRLMVEELRFLQPRYSLRSLSEDSGVPVYQLSLFMNKYYQISYNDFINRQRVAYCEKKISAGECNMKTLEALASESGFNNRTSFTQSFKRFTGLTPSAYLREAQAGSLKSTGSSEQSLANRFVDVVIA